MSRPFSIACLALCFALGLSLPAPRAQDADASAANAASSALLHADELVTRFYTPRHLPQRDAARLARNVHGRPIHVLERGGYNSRPVENIQEFGDSILVCDDAQSADRILAWLSLIDQPVSGPSQDGPTLVTRRWSPAHVSLSTGIGATRAFQREVIVRGEDGERRGVQNLAVVEERNLLVLHDTTEQVAAMVELLAAIDQPEPQLMVTAMVLVGERSQAGQPHQDGGLPAPPEELSASLARLVPYDHFRMRSLGVVRSSARAGEIELRMDNGDSLQLKPDAYDESTGDLSARCSYRSGQAFQFETRTTLRGGEWTVLGASGGEALFAVVRVEPVED